MELRVTTSAGKPGSILRSVAKKKMPPLPSTLVICSVLVEIGKGRRKIATGRFRINMAGAHEGSSFSHEVNNAINEEKSACSHRSCIGNNVFNKADDILHHYTIILTSH